GEGGGVGPPGWVFSRTGGPHPPPLAVGECADVRRLSALGQDARGAGLAIELPGVTQAAVGRRRQGDGRAVRPDSAYRFLRVILNEGQLAVGERDVLALHGA